MSDINNEDAAILFQEAQERFLNNLAYFKEHNKEIYDTFSNYKASCPINFSVSKNNYLNVSFNNKDLFYDTDDVDALCKEQVDYFLKYRDFFIIKDDEEMKDWYGQIQFRYKNQCAKLVNNYLKDFDLNRSKLNAIPLLFCMGIGLGYYLYHILSQIEVQNLFLLEPNEEAFYASLYTFDYANVLSFAHDNNIHVELLIGDLSKRLRYKIAIPLIDRGIHLTSLSFLFIHYQNDLMQKEISALVKDYYFLNLGTGFFDDSLFALNNTYNLLLQNKSLAKKSNFLQHEKVPVFVIGNGPSLDYDLNFLRKNQDKALIVACGTAIETLFHEGIQADFYVAVERIHDIASTLNIFKHNNYLDNVILLTTNVVHKNTLDFFKKEIIFAKENEYSNKIFSLDDKYAKLKDKWTVVHMVNPLVINMALSALFELNFSNFYLFGIDNGTKIEGQYHSSKSKLYQDYNIVGDYVIIKDNMTIEGNFGGNVYTTVLYKICLCNLEDLILYYMGEHNGNFTITNCSDGALIKNTLSCKSSKVDKKLHKNIVDKEKLKQDILDNYSFKANLDEDYFNKVFDCNAFYDIVDHISALLHKDAKTRMEYLNISFEIYNFINTLDDTKDQFRSLLIGSFIQYLSFIQQILYSDNSEEICIERVHEIIKIIDCFLSDAKELFKHAREFTMGEHLKITSNYIGFNHENNLAPLYKKEYDSIQCNVDVSQETFTKRYI